MHPLTQPQENKGQGLRLSEVQETALKCMHSWITGGCQRWRGAFLMQGCVCHGLTVAQKDVIARKMAERNSGGVRDVLVKGSSIQAKGLGYVDQKVVAE